MKRLIIPFLIVSVTILVIFLLFGSFESIAENLINAYRDNPAGFSLVSFIILVSDIVLPVPSTIIMYTNGFVLGLVNGTLLSLVSLMLSCILGWVIGKWTPFSKADARSVQLFGQFGPYSIILTRGIPILAETISVVSGYASMPFRSFVMYNFIGYVPICILYAYLGEIANEKSAFGMVLLISLGVTIIFWWFGSRLKKNQQ